MEPIAEMEQSQQPLPEPNRRRRLLFLCIALLAIIVIGIGIFFIVRGTSHETKRPADAVLRDTTPFVLTPEASGETVYTDELLSLDISNTSEGYVILTYHGTNEKVKFQIEAPDGITYTYLVPRPDQSIVLPLTGGDGSYHLTLLESVDIEHDRYAIVHTKDMDVTLDNEFLPYLTPNVYVSYDTNSTVIQKGAELASECYCELDVIEHVYNYVTGSIAYDEEKAASVAYGYLPDPDLTLSTQKGICFDYASLMTALLRTQKIPTKLQVGYAGEAYHAWISCYVEEIGWVNNIIEFDGEHWSLMDPTLAANNSDESVAEYIGDGSTYLVKYTY